MNQNYDSNLYEWPPFAIPQKEELYNRKKALPYWHRLSTHDAIITLSVEMLSSIAHIRIGISVLNAEANKDKLMLFKEKTDLVKFQERLSDLYDAVHELASILHFYGVNHKKALEDFSSEGIQGILPIDKIESPTRFSKIYLDFLPDWYQQTPEKFLSTVIPLFETKLSQLGSLIKKLHREAEVNNILLRDGKFALGVVTSEMLRGINIMDEEFFLLKSHADSKHK